MAIFTNKFLKHAIQNSRKISKFCRTSKKIVVLDKEYNVDSMTNVNKGIHDLLQRQLHLQQYHPLNHVKQCIVNFFHQRYKNTCGNPLFSMHDHISPIVTTIQNFDSLLTPPDHPARQKEDSFYINEQYMLRSHMTAHQADLIKMGLDNFLFIGDVFRRDQIDKSHFPAFHQVDGVRLFSKVDVFKDAADTSEMSIFMKGERTDVNQGVHADEATEALTADLKLTLTALAHRLYGEDVETRWVDAYFPFTCPSWELEIKFNGEWMEVLGCGIMEQNILSNAGASEKVGWAFGLGLERLAMNFYSIPDIRYFWSTDPGFLYQFKFEDPHKKVKFKVVSSQPPLRNDISFWIPTGGKVEQNDFYDLVREFGGDIVEQVYLFDKFVHPKTQRRSQAYRIVYRSLEGPLKQDDISNLHMEIGNKAEERFGVEIRRIKTK